MTPLWILVFLMNIITPAQAVDFSRPSFLSVKPGEGVTLNCSFGPAGLSKNVYWYKQIFGEMPQTVGKQLSYSDINIFKEFKTSGFKMDVTDENTTLIIPHVKKEDEGLYYCAKSYMDDFILFTGTYLGVKGNADVKVSVLQRGMWDSVWCESDSSTHTCVYNFSKNIINLNDTGTYYCTMALCGKIVFGNGAPVQNENAPKLGPEVIYLAVVVAVCVVVIFTQAFIICKVKSSEQSRVRSAVKRTSNQGRDADEMNYTASYFNKKNTTKMKREGEKPDDFVYSEVVYTH